MPSLTESAKIDFWWNPKPSARGRWDLAARSNHRDNNNLDVGRGKGGGGTRRTGWRILGETPWRRFLLSRTQIHTSIHTFKTSFCPSRVALVSDYSWIFWLVCFCIPLFILKLCLLAGLFRYSIIHSEAVSEVCLYTVVCLFVCGKDCVQRLNKTWISTSGSCLCTQRRHSCWQELSFRGVSPDIILVVDWAKSTN